MYLVGIAGGSGSGKTTFAKKIIKQARSKEIELLHLDAYYLPRASEELYVNGKGNFDHPRAFDWELLKTHLEEIKRGKSVSSPIYDFTVSRRTKRTAKIGPCKILLVEGIFTLWDAGVRDLFDLRVYLQVDADIRFIRRLHRDLQERGRSYESVVEAYYATVRPMHHEFLEPTQKFADLIVGEETDRAADVLASHLAYRLKTPR